MTELLGRTATPPAETAATPVESAALTAVAEAAHAILAANPASTADDVDDAVAQALTDYNKAAVAGDRELLPAEAQARLRQAAAARIGALGALAPLLADDTIEDICCNGCDNVWVTRYDGTREQVGPVAESDEQLIAMIRALASGAGAAEIERRFDRASPALNLRLPDDSRLHAIMSVASRPSVSIRRHRIVEATLDQLQAGGMFGPAIADLLRAAVAASFNIIVAGPFRSGKTTLVGALAGEVPFDERILTIEDVRELGLDTDSRHGNVVALETREANIEGEGAISATALFRESLRMSPDRIILSEVRGPEVRVMLEAMSTGTDGSLSTIHTSSSSGVFPKIQSFGRDAGLEPAATAAKIAEGLDLVVQLRHHPRLGRFISSIREVAGADGTMVASNELWEPGPDGRAVPGTPISTARAHRLAKTGWRPPEPTRRWSR